MSKKTIIIYIGVGCLLAVLTVWSYHSTEKRMLEVAEQTFVEAVHQDLDERWKKLGETVTIVSGKDKEVYTNLTIDRDGINKSFALEDNNDSLNIDGDINQRMLHTILYEFDRKCNPDTLNHIWQEKLVANGMDIATVASVHYDAESTDSLVSHYKLLSSYYAGISNEIRLSSFVRLSLGDVLFHRPLLFLCVGLLIVWIVLMIWKIPSKTKPLAIPEKEGYRLSQNVVFDSDARCFIKDAQKIILTPKGSLIIKALLEAENHQLHGADLLAKAWDSNETNMNKLYIQNTKLRTILKDLGDGFDIVSMDRSHFRFVFPYSRESRNTLKT